MKYPCQCWESGPASLNGTIYCENCGAKYNSKYDEFKNETITEQVIREIKEKRVIKRERNIEGCLVNNCAWYIKDSKRDNCFRDVGDCRFIEK